MDTDTIIAAPPDMVGHSPHLDHCSYVGTDGVPCIFKALPGGENCFWHDPDIPKTGSLVGPLLARLASEDVNLEGFQLAGINLECLRLTAANLISANLHGARLFKAHLENAQLFGANLSGASLFKASLAGANLRSADLTNANLLSANLKGARMEGVDLGDNAIILNEHKGDQAARKGNRAEAHKYWHEANEIYLALLNNHRDEGHQDEAGEIFYRLMVVKRKLLPRFTVTRWGSWVMDLLCGYGERPMRVISVWILLVLICSLAFGLLGITEGRTGNDISLRMDAKFGENLHAYLLCLYFSIITMTTTGYGDIQPMEAARAVAATEAFCGAFLMALIVLAVGRKMTR